MKTCAVLLFGLTFALAGCSKRAEPAAESEPDEPKPSATVPASVNKPVDKPDFATAAAQPAYQEAVRQIARVFGAQPKPMEDVPGGFVLAVPQAKVEAQLFRLHTNYLSQGVYVFRHEQHFGIGGNPDKIGILPTADKYAVIAAVETDGANFDLYTGGIIAWLKDLEKEQPFILTGVGMDFLEGRFSSPVNDPAGLAKRMYQFCPDIVDQGVDTVQGLEKELRKGRLYYFWWD